MKLGLLATLILILFGSIISFADNWVNGYTKKDGTYVQGHFRTSPNSNPYDNYSTKGNANPYTGERGNKSPYESFQKPYTNPYSSPYGTRKQK